VRAEWAEASIGRRVIFALSAAYWLGMLFLLVLALPSSDSGAAAGRIVGFYLSPLILAIIVRLGYVLFSRRRPRPPIVSWWVLVIGAALGLLLGLQRAVGTIADRAGT
jgi:uncharacterized membrane protein